MIVLGIHAGGHDIAAALIQNDKILAAVSEERITRDKLSFGVPYNAIDEVMMCAGITPQDVDEIAIETLVKPHFLRGHARPWYQQIYITRGKKLLDFIYIKNKRLQYIYGPLAVPLNLIAMTGVPRLLTTDVSALFYIRKKFGFNKKITFVNHHIAHLASAYFTAGEEEVLSIVIEAYDGENTFKIDAVRDGIISNIATTPYPNSPGDFYTLITRMLGYNYLLHCGKITGLAAYGNPAKAYPLIEKLMWNEGMEIRLSPFVYKLIVDYARTKQIPDYFQGNTPEDLAAAFQRRLEDTIVPIVELAVKKTGVKTLALSGGVVSNVKLNQRIFDIPGVEKVFVHPAMSDTGTALGAALWVVNKRKKLKPFRLKNVFLGYEITNKKVEEELEHHGLRYSRREDIYKDIAKFLSDKKIVIRVAGKMEYGPRALGNRSILYHCNDPDINKSLNHRLRRTEFMPFAPAIMSEHAERCFKNYKGAEYTSEFMTITFECTGWMKENCPAVVHVDGTARPQFVYKENNPGFYAILAEYYNLTGVPVLINTSYNIHDEPIVRTEEDAIRIFKLTCLDYLAIGDYLVSASENNLIWDDKQ